jgi:predicted MFS family arabinose efflux permease
MTRQVQSAFVPIALLAAIVLMVTTGARQSLGLFVSPLAATTGLGIVTISFAMAVAQFVWGAIQPIAGALADRYGHARVLVAGIALTALGNAVTPFMTSAWGLVFAIGIISAVGTGTGSFAVLIGATARRVSAASRGMASGIVNAGGSFGQFLFAPLTQMLISTVGWMGAMWSLAGITLFAIPVALGLREPVGGGAVPAEKPAAAAPFASLRSEVSRALGDRSYFLLNAGFFTCGFHIAFLVTHLPGEVALCGLPSQVASWSLAIIGLANVAGSLLAGWALRRYRGKSVLFVMYSSRSVLILLYLLAPKTIFTFGLFAAGLGLTWLATVPPTAGIIGKLFGTRYLATLFGFSLLAHQIGGFFGAWLGGIVLSRFGNYTLMWHADMALAAAAALVNLPIREDRPVTAALERVPAS